MRFASSRAAASGIVSSAASRLLKDADILVRSYR
jgi:hypothetical protein